MCGIAGFVSAASAPDSGRVDAVRRMTNRMSLRGPDAEGIWTKPGIALGHRRLAILDLDARSNQPMLGADGNLTIVFNGERDIEATILSVLSQTFTDREYLVVDGLSADGTMAVVASFADRIDQVIREED